MQGTWRTSEVERENETAWLTFSLELMESLKNIMHKNLYSGNVDCFRFYDFAYWVFSLLGFSLFFCAASRYFKWSLSRSLRCAEIPAIFSMGAQWQEVTWRPLLEVKCSDGSLHQEKPHQCNQLWVGCSVGAPGLPFTSLRWARIHGDSLPGGAMRMIPSVCPFLAVPALRASRSGSVQRSGSLLARVHPPFVPVLPPQVHWLLTVGSEAAQHQSLVLWHAAQREGCFLYHTVVLKVTRANEYERVLANVKGYVNCECNVIIQL